MAKLREMLDSDDIIVSVGVYTPLTAMMAERVGFKSAIIPGWTIGAMLGITEPLTTMTETLEITRAMHHVSDIALSVDVGAGWGNASNIPHMVRSFEEAGAQCIHLEDQVVPKRIDYHLGKHFIISTEEMMHKLECAVSARRSKDFIIVARTDAGRNEGETFENAIERANLYASTGVDMVKVFARTEEEMLEAPKRVKAPLWYVASEGLGRPIPTPQEAKAMGYKGISYPQTAIQASYKAVMQIYKNIHDTGRSGFTKAETKALADEIMSVISIDKLAQLDPKLL